MKFHFNEAIHARTKFLNTSLTFFKHKYILFYNNEMPTIDIFCS